MIASSTKPGNVLVTMTLPDPRSRELRMSGRPPGAARRTWADQDG